MECVENPFRYELISGSVIGEDQVARLEYGIEAKQGDQTVARFEGVCCNGNTMEMLVALCNEGLLDLCQLQDVIEDFCQNDYTLGDGQALRTERLAGRPAAAGLTDQKNFE